MSDANTSAPAETAPVRDDFAPEPNAHDVALSLSDDGFDFDDDDGDPNPGDPAYDHAERQIEQPRGEGGRFAPRNPAQAPQEGEGEPESVDGEPEGEEAAGEAPESEEQPDAEGEKKPEAEKPKAAAFVEIDGEKIPVEEIGRGFMRTKDYTQKTQEVAELRRSVSAEQEAVRRDRMAVNEILAANIEFARGNLPERPDDSLIDQDVIAYNRQMAAHNRAIEKYQSLLDQRQNLNAQTEAEQTREREQHTRSQQEQMAQVLQREARLMTEHLPELRTPEGQKAFMDEAVKYGADYGITANDIAGIQDHRMLRVLKDWIAQRKLQTAKPEVMERVRNAPPIRPAVRQGAGTRQGQANRQAQDAFRRNPTIDGAVASLPDSMFGLD